MRTVVWPPRKSDSPDTRTGSGFLLFACPATRAPYFSIRFGAGLCLRSGTASRAVYRSEPASGQCLFRGLFRTIHLGLFLLIPVMRSRSMRTPSQLAEVLRETIRRVEQNADVGPDDPALLELKRIILLRIAALERDEPGMPAEEPMDIPAVPQAETN